MVWPSRVTVYSTGGILRAECFDELVGLGQFDAGVAGAVHHHQWCADTVDAADRGAGKRVGILLRVGRVADMGEPVVGEHRLDRAGLAAHEVGQVGDADDVDDGGEDVRGESGAGQ